MRFVYILLALALLVSCAQPSLPPQLPTPVSAPPLVDKEITVIEGAFVSLGVSALDPDGDLIDLTFSPPFDASGTWQTNIGDAGTYEVTILASDGKLTTSKRVRVVVEPENKPPTIAQIPAITLRVGDTVRFEPVVYDPNGDPVTLTYSGWIVTNERRATEEDIGTQYVTIIASDGALSVQQTATLTVLPANHPPTIAPLPSLIVFEGDTITLNPQAADPDRDTLTISYAGWMTHATYTASYEDAGVHEVVVTAFDGERSAVQKVFITVKDRPRAPEIVLG